MSHAEVSGISLTDQAEVSSFMLWDSPTADTLVTLLRQPQACAVCKVPAEDRARRDSNPHFLPGGSEAFAEDLLPSRPEQPLIFGKRQSACDIG
jgi:hypothetical protein